MVPRAKAPRYVQIGYFIFDAEEHVRAARVNAMFTPPAVSQENPRYPFHRRQETKTPLILWVSNMKAAFLSKLHLLQDRMLIEF